MSETRLVDVTGRVRSPAATPGHVAGCAPSNKGAARPGGPAHRRGDHPRHAPGRTRTLRGSNPGSGRDPVARRAGDQRGPRPRRDRPRPEDRVSPPSLREGREAAHGRDRRLGLGPRRPLDRAPHRAVDRSAVLPPRQPDPGTGMVSDRRAGRASPPRRAGRGCGGDSPRTSSGTLTPSRWRTKGSRWRSSRGNSGMRTSGSHRSPCRESTRERSSTPSITAGHR
jgi:hypothetical protein